jgi:hypothetical protein
MFTKLKSTTLRSALPALGSTLLLGSFAMGCAEPPATQDLQPRALEQVAATAPADVDILYMIDNSGSMKEEQDKLRRNFPAFIDTLRELPGGLPNLHVGIVSSDLGAGNIFLSGNPACNRSGGDRGELQVRAGCGLDAKFGNFLISLNNDSQHNFTGTLASAFACMADLGTAGCGFEHQLQSIRLALNSTSTPANQGFLRSSAILMVIMVTDEDDCSGQPSSSLYADPSFTDQTGSLRCNIKGHLCNGVEPPQLAFSTALENCTANPNGLLIPIQTIRNDLLALKPNHPERIIVSAITGKPKPGTTPMYQFAKTADSSTLPGVLDVAPICSSGADGTAAPALRITEFVKSFGANGTIESICEGNFVPAFGRLGALLSERLMAQMAGAVNTPPTQDAGSPTTGGMGEPSVAIDGGTNSMPGSSTGDTAAPEATTQSSGGTGGGGTGGGAGGGAGGPVDEDAKANSGCSYSDGSPRSTKFNHWGGLLFAALAFCGLRRQRRT